MKKDKCKTIYYSFYQRELIIKNSCLPPFLCSFMPFLFISVVNMWKVEMYPGLSVFIYENSFVFFFCFFSSLQCDIC